MPDDTHLTRALPTHQDVQVFRSDFDAALNYYTPQIADALPDDIPLHRFKRVLITAINQNPDLYRADRTSLFNACVKCAQDGLYPDGQEAALVVFNTEVKKKDDKGIEHSVWVPLVQYMPMIRGVRKRMRNSGEVLSAIAEVVYRNDKFRHVKGEDEKIEHEPCDLSDDPGEPVGAYAIIKLANGEILRDVMPLKDIEKSRAQSRAKNSLMWTKFWGEGAKKTVLRRCAKGAPQDSHMRRLMGRDDEPLELPAVEHITLPPPRPTREASGIGLTVVDSSDPPEKFEPALAKLKEALGQNAKPAETDETGDETAVGHTDADDGAGSSSEADAGPSGGGASPAPTYEITEGDGEIFDTDIDEVENHLLEVFHTAQLNGPKAIEAAIENNEPTVDLIRKDGHHELANRLSIEIAQMRRSLQPGKPKRRRARDAEMAEQARLILQEESFLPEQNPADGPQAQSPAGVSPQTATLSSGASPAPPSETATSSARPDYTLPMVTAEDGSPALYQWAHARLLVELRKAKTAEEAEAIQKANREHIAAYKATLTPIGGVTFQKEIDAFARRFA